MVDFKNVKFIKSAPSAELRPDGLFDVMFVGRSNVGKSSLINALCSKKDLAYTSSKPGHTRLLNYYDVDGRFYLVDAPGYGYVAKGPKDAFADMMEGYFKTSKPRLIIFLFDSRRIPNEEDISFLRYLINAKISVLLVLTKADKLNQSEKAAIDKNVKPLSSLVKNHEYLLASIKRRESLIQVTAAIAALVA
ncbi:MAG: ribosome biogenesis GTP-binding protein YsxC [Bacteroidia bacterium]|nr:ribosome biogenesis GTP-binding protein YsxC [Bacteroidia bacterium]